MFVFNTLLNYVLIHSISLVLGVTVHFQNSVNVAFVDLLRLITKKYKLIMLK